VRGYMATLIDELRATATSLIDATAGVRKAESDLVAAPRSGRSPFMTLPLAQRSCLSGAPLPRSAPATIVPPSVGRPSGGSDLETSVTCVRFSTARGQLLHRNAGGVRQGPGIHTWRVCCYPLRV
jgi:hypothetical protein